MSDQEKVKDAKIVEQFLAEPAVQAAIDRLHKQYYKDFREADTPEKRELAHAKARVLDGFAAELMSVRNAGTQAKANLEKEAQAEERRKQQESRRQPGRR